MKRQPLKIGITGLFGCGKTSLAFRLAPRYDREIAYLSGDLLLAKNMANVSEKIDRYVLEHIDLSSFVLRKQIVLDALIFINIPVSTCIERCYNRLNHTCNAISEFEIIYRDIYEQFCEAAEMEGVFCRELRTFEMETIWQDDMYDEVLIAYLFRDAPWILDRYKG